MTTVIELDPATYEATVSRDGVVLVDAWAPWCGPCRQFAPVFAKAAAEYPDHLFAKLDTQAHPDLMKVLGVEHIPTLIVYRDGIMIYNRAGSPGAEVLADIVRQVESLDMDEVKANLDD